MDIELYASSCMRDMDRYTSPAAAAAAAAQWRAQQQRAKETWECNCGVDMPDCASVLADTRRMHIRR
jgi:hypothetical protein